jgi:hypothetical protein
MKNLARSRLANIGLPSPKNEEWYYFPVSKLREIDIPEPIESSASDILGIKNDKFSHTSQTLLNLFNLSNLTNSSNKFFLLFSTSVLLIVDIGVFFVNKFSFVRSCQIDVVTLQRDFEVGGIICLNEYWVSW